ncbi:penicillin-binding transpeptidase domain-containing protein [Sinomonas sp. JGH33]|uniref:Penicillin-binding transpeptidase domain-containing protein n=1 Tax=Sinomonas terricola TaxID=3110330 RepID=A0ABU5T7V6_9MICC|nr:penicillin-binding transpeptidase domain-containing protein [Sinomonas sp. JGH33]MEA5455531.1 penicillin-binding transpeptidase domain-containing protein [Sinomonas sp. JGH33]
MGNLRTVTFVLSAALLGAALAACDDGSQAAAQQAADQLSKALSALDVSQAPITGSDPGAAQTQLKAVVEGLGDVRPAVTAGHAATSSGTTTVPLDFRWELAGREWKYTTTAQVAQDGGHWAVRWAPGLLAPGLQDGEVLVAQTTTPARGDIIGAGDAKLVTERPVVRVGIDKTKVTKDLQDSSARALAALVGLDPSDYAKQVAAAGEKAFVEAIVLRDTPDRTPTSAQITAVPGAVAIADTLPLAPTKAFGRAVLGTVGQATAEQIQKSGGELSAGDLTGTGGLEEKYDNELRGKEGVTVFAVRSGGSGQPSASAAPSAGKAAPSPSPSGSAKRSVFEAAPEPGTPVRTTIDPRLQQLADDTLAAVGPASAIVAIRPSDGAVLAAASGPGSKGYNTAMLGQYAPGSIFKTVDSLALLRQGATPELPVECTPTLTVDGKTFQNATGYPAAHLGTIPLRDAYAHSCNTAFISQRDKVSQEQLAATATSLGVGVDAPLLGADAFLGSVPDQAGSTEHAASMIGQGKVLFSPLAAAVMAASVAKGDRVSPRLVLSVGEHDEPAAGSSATPGATASPTAKEPVGKPISQAEASTLQDMMRAVVTSGHAGFLLSVPGAPVGAKTGTAEFGSDNPPKTHAWIIGIHGDLAVAVFVDEGGLGATVSGPLLTTFLTKAAQ